MSVPRQPGAPPFIVCGMPRSRTAWLAEFLSTPDRPCPHEPTVGWSSISDLWRFLDTPGAAASDASLTWLWRDILAFRPDTRIVVMLRPASLVRRSAIAAGIPVGNPDGLDGLFAEAGRLARAPRRFRVLSAWFSALVCPSVLRAVYCHCHDAEPPAGRIEALSKVNIQADIPARLAEGMANLAGWERLMSQRSVATTGWGADR